MAAQSQDLRSLHPSNPQGRFDSLTAWLQWLEESRAEHIHLGLERCRDVAANLGLSKPARTVVTVAGTNGKGSSVAMLERIWRQAGYRVGTYTSPHLVKYNERVRIDGVAADDATICAGFEAVERTRRDVPLTYFEFGTLAALGIFERARLDIAILEVGLGGRLDAVNMIDPDVALITSIGIDHEDWLGSTREEIAVEKAGIMRRARPVVCSDNDIPEALIACAEAFGARVDVLGVDYGFEEDDSAWTWWSGPATLTELPLPRLAGNHQLRNAAGVLKVVNILQQRHPVAQAEIHRGLETVVLQGRFQRIAGDVEMILDVAHNPQAAESFVSTLSAMPGSGQTHALIGMLKTKDHVGYLRRLMPVVDIWYFATLPGSLGASADDLRGSLEGVGANHSCSCYRTVEDAHAAIAAQANDGDRILVLGSFLTVGAVMKTFKTTGGMTR